MGAMVAAHPPTALVCDPAYREHDTGRFHPERAARVDAVVTGLHRAALLEHCRVVAPRPAAEADLLRCHTPTYLRRVREDIAAGRGQLSTGDTAIGPSSEAIARLAAGGVLAAADAVMEGVARNAFAVVRPPGHHATPSRGMGFCLYNNVAVAARYLQAVHGIERVLIVDWDVHHGNGTQEIFWRDPSVLFFSTHQMPLYPGTGHAEERGAGAGLGMTLNCPFGPGAGGTEILAAYREVLEPAAEAFSPQMVLVSAGFDSRLGDPLGDFRLTDGDYREMTARLMAIADRHARGRLVSSLEGGYDLAGLAAAGAAHMGALQGR